jgi:hypothetical protein
MSRKAVLERMLGKKAAKRFVPKPIALGLPTEFIDQVVGVELAKAHGSLTKDLRARKRGSSIALFDTDKDRDVEIIQSHLQAFETVAGYYGVPLGRRSV